MIDKERALILAHQWLNSGGSAQGARRIGLHEFPLGWVVWAVPPPPERDPATGRRRPPAEVGTSCGVVDRRTGELTVWPSVPAEEVARMYTEKHGGDEGAANDAAGVTGPGNTAAFGYTDPAKGESYLTRVSAPGMPPAEYQVWFELQRMGVPLETVTSVHTDLRPSLLPGGYTIHFLSRIFPNAELSCTHDYGADPEERTRNIMALHEHAKMMNGLVGQPPPPTPHRVPVPVSLQRARPLDDRVLGRQLDGIAWPDGVLRYPPGALAAQPLFPESTRATLVEAGLPAAMPFFFVADDPRNPPPGGLFADAAAHLRAVGTEATDDALRPLSGHVRIGTDGLYVVTVQCRGPEGSLGTVWAANPENGAGRYVNASVAAFARSLALLQVARSQLPGLDPVAAGGVLTAFQRQLVSIDQTALGKEMNWWSVLVEQMWHGLF